MNNGLPKNCLISTEQSSQSIAFILGLIQSKQGGFQKTIIFTEKIKELKENLDFLSIQSAGMPLMYSVSDFVENGDNCLTIGDRANNPNIYLQEAEVKIKNDTKTKVKQKIGEKNNTFVRDVTKFQN